MFKKDRVSFGLFGTLFIILVFDLYLVKYNVSVSTPSPSSPPATLLVLVIAGGETKHYDFYRHFWEEIAILMQQEGIYIYLLSYSSSIGRVLYNKRDHSLQFPGRNSLIPGCLESTILAMESITANQLPGHDAPVILRTNLSTFWNFWMVLQHLRRPDMNISPTKYLYAGLQYNFNGESFIPGGYLFLNQKSMRLLIQNKSELDMGTIDDMAIGNFMAKKGIPITYNIGVCIIENEEMVEKVLTKQECRELFIYRIKTANPMDDTHLWLHLFMKFYEHSHQSNPVIALPSD